MSLKKPKHRGNCELKSRPCPSPSQALLNFTSAVPDKKDQVFSITELESLNSFLSSQIISEANLKFGALTVEKPGFSGWSLVDTKFLSGDALQPRNEVPKQKRAQQSVRCRRNLAFCNANSTIRWVSTPPPSQSQQLITRTKSDGRGPEAHKLILHSQTNRFIEDYRDVKMKSLREPKSVTALCQRQACNGVRGRSVECGFAINDK